MRLEPEFSYRVTRLPHLGAGCWFVTLSTNLNVSTVIDYQGLDSAHKLALSF